MIIGLIINKLSFHVGFVNIGSFTEFLDESVVFEYFGYVD